MEFSIKCCKGCMAAYNYGDYVYFKKMTDITNRHHNHLILNQMTDFHITPPFKLMDDIFESSPKLFVDKMLKKSMNNICPNCGSVIKSQCMEQVE